MKKWLIKIMGVDELIQKHRRAHQELVSFVWANCKMADSANKSDKDYDTEEVTEKWLQFHKLAYWEKQDEAK